METEQKELYHALDGTEVLKWALLDAGQKLAEYVEFGKARAYHNPRYTLRLQIEAFDAQQTYIAEDVSVTIEAQKQTNAQDSQAVSPVADRSASDGPVRTPDKVRDRLENGRFKTKKIDGILCDIREEVKKEQIEASKAKK